LPGPQSGISSPTVQAFCSGREDPWGSSVVLIAAAAALAFHGNALLILADVRFLIPVLIGWFFLFS
ncbi:MAG: hypothetical protein O8C67_00200, partial [Candidatus Methanoperedens sp.]|nr:hypothetical protein [Candidatus Methanoperedens sp.]